MGRKLFIFGFFALVLTVGLTLNAHAEDGTIFGADEIGAGEVTDISINDLNGIPLSRIPKAEAFLIWVRWTPGVNQPQVTYLFNIKQDTTRTFTHLLVKKNTMSGVVGEACCQAIVPWADSGQTVAIIGLVKDVGFGYELFPVE